MKKPVILNLIKPIKTDNEFYKRWERVGKVIRNAPEQKDGIEVLAVDFNTEVTDEFLEDFEDLKYICSPTTGHTHLKYSNENIKLITLRGETGFLREVRSVAEFTFKQMLELSRPKDRLGQTLAGKMIGIIGIGRIGNHVLQIAKTFQMKPLLYDKPSNKKELRLIFKLADFIVIALDENPSTIGLIDQKLLYSMKSTAFLINNARGSIVDELALVKSVRSGIIAGAAVDTIHIKEAYENISNINLIVSPHIAGWTLEDRIKTDEFIIQKLEREINGRSH